jgi:hypothetical protein
MKKNVIIFLVIFLLAIAGCVNNLGLSGSYINIQNNHTCLDLSSDGTYLLRSVGSSVSLKENYEIKNNKLLLTLPTNLLFGQDSQNNLVITCDVNGDILNCGKDGGTYQKTDSCNTLDPKRIIPTPKMSSYQCLANTRLTQSAPDKDHVTFGLKYQDTCGLTTDVIFFVKTRSDKKTVYSKDLGNPGTSLVTDSYTVPNIRGQEYIWNYDATRSDN